MQTLAGTLAVMDDGEGEDVPEEDETDSLVGTALVGDVGDRKSKRMAPQDSTKFSLENWRVGHRDWAMMVAGFWIPGLLQAGGVAAWAAEGLIDAAHDLPPPGVVYMCMYIYILE
jgi:hypothetical protein